MAGMAKPLLDRFLSGKHALGAVLLGLVANLITAGSDEAGQVARLVVETCNVAPGLLVTLVLALAAFMALATRAWLPSPKQPCYLVDTYCFKPPKRMQHTRQQYIETARSRGIWDEPALDFQERLLASSGLGDATAFPDGIVAEPMRLDWASALEESELVMYSTVEGLLSQTGLAATDIDALVVMCSCFAPTPSLSTMIVNRFKMRTDVITFNLAGHGCSGGAVAIDLANHYLQSQAGKRVLVVASENITHNQYMGNNRSMLVSNCLFRLGGAAVLLSNRPQDKGVAKYELLHSVRTHIGGDDDCFNAIRQIEDEESNRGIRLQKNVVAAAGKALEANMRMLAPHVLPLIELARAAANPRYVPDFKTAFDHFLVHTGGRAVIEEVEKKLSLEPKHVQPSKDTLWRFGNTCCAAIFYVLTCMETKVGVRKGERVWQLGFGVGFKVNSLVWRALRDINTEHVAWTEDAAAE